MQLPVLLRQPAAHQLFDADDEGEDEDEEDEDAPVGLEDELVEDGVCSAHHSGLMQPCNAMRCIVNALWRNTLRTVA